MNKEKRAALFAISITSLLVMMAISPISVILPTIASDLQVDVTTAGWVVGAFLLAVTALLLTCGRLGDLFGHRRVFLWGAVLYTVAGTLGGFAGDALQLIILRALQGVGAAMISGNSLAIVVQAFSPEERGKAIGVTGMAASVGGFIGILIASVFAQYLSWRWLFYLNLPLGLLALKSALDMPVGLRPSQRPRVDMLGGFFLAAALVAFSLSLSHFHEGEATFQAGSFYHVSLQSLSLVLAALFVWVETRAPQPIVDLPYLRQALFATSVAANGIMHMTMMAATFLVPFLFERGLGLTPLHTAGQVLAFLFGNIVAAPFSGWLFDRTRWRFLGPVAMAGITLGLVLLGLLPTGLAYWGFLSVGLLLGLGLGFFQTPNNTIVMGALPTSHLGFAAGMLETSRQLGHTLGVTASSAALGLVLASSLSQLQPTQAYILGFQQAALLAGGVNFLGVLLSIASARLQQPTWEPAAEAMVSLAEEGS